MISDSWERSWRGMIVKKNDYAWVKILEEVGAISEIDRKDYCDIESKDIKKYREPRLACKIDRRQNTPKPLREENLSVLAIKNGCYRLARTDPFVEVDEQKCRSSKPSDCFPLHTQVLTRKNLSSESKALDAAFISGMLCAVTGDKPLSLVLRGREYCNPIEFSLPGIKAGQRAVDYKAEKVQVEVDGGYEGKAGIHLFEVKCGLVDNINLRQLLYPQLHYKNLHKKPVKAYLMFYDRSNGYFHFFRFKGANGRHHFSDYRCYTLE